MHSNDDLKSILQSAKSLRLQNRTSSIVLENYLYYQYLKVTDENSSSWRCGICTTSKAEVSKSFKNTFKKLSKLEKARFYFLNVSHVKRFLSQENPQTQLKAQKNSNLNDKSIVYETSNKKVFMKGGHKLNQQKQVTIQIFQKQNLIKIIDTKQQIDLQFYLLRRSTCKQKMVIIFEPIEQSNYQFRISQSAIDFLDLQKIIYSVWQQSQYEVIKRMLRSDSKYPVKRSILKTVIQTNNEQPLTLRLSKSNPNTGQKQSLRQSLDMIQLKPSAQSPHKQRKMNRIQHELLPKDLIQSLSSLKNFEQKSYGVYFDKSGRKVRKIFTFSSNTVSQQLIISVIDDLRHIRNRKDSVHHIKVLNSIPTEQTNIYHEINELEGEEFQFIYFRHFFTRSSAAIFIDKSIDGQAFNILKSNKIRPQIIYCLWRVRSYGNNTQLLVEAEISYPKGVKNSQAITNQYIGEFNSYINNRCISNLLDQPELIKTEDFENQYLSQLSEGQFVTVTGSFDYNQQPSFFNSSSDQSPLMKKQKQAKIFEIAYEPDDNDLAMNQQINMPEQQAIHNANYLKYLHIVEPLKQKQPQYLLCESGHPIWGNQWIISKDGYLVNVNHQKIRVQSSVLKLVVQRMGRNLLSGKSIINMSLPIEIFGTDSNLQRLARAYTYAPRFIQKAAVMQSPLERLKQSVCFAMGFSISYIQMEKPFNPILGQTYQGLVDGCPVYGQQISHHPPISSLYMQGRGYTINGSYQAKVEMGVNSASGINQGFSEIIFQKYGSLKFNNPAGQISGLIYGDRKLTLTKKSWFVDKQNRLFLQISWGKNKLGRHGLGHYNDYFSGIIAKIKQGISLDDHRKIKSSHFQFQHGQIYGRMNDKVFFESEELFDISRDLPYKIQDYLPCLESDSTMRKDIAKRKIKDFIGAQQAKEYLQQIQRNDKKLRK